MSNTASITPTKPAPRPPFLSACVISLALLTLIVTLPCLATDILLLREAPVRELLVQDQPTTDNDLNLFEQSWEKVARWRPTNDIFDDLTMAELRRFKDQKSIGSLQQAVHWQQLALTQSPADTYGWSRLAFMYLSKGMLENAALALEHSIDAAPYEPRLVMSRVAMAMRLEDKLSPRMNARVPTLVKQAWKQDPNILIYMARHAAFLHQAEAILSDDPQSLEQFRKLTAPLPTP